MAQEEPFFSETTYRQETPANELWKCKEKKCRAVPTVPPVFTVSCCYTNDLHKDTTIVNIAQLTKPSRALTEHDSGSTVLNLKREMSGLSTDEQLLINDARLMSYYGCKKNVLLSKMIYYADNTTTILEKWVTYKSSCLDTYSMLLQPLHGTAGKQPGVSKMMLKIRQTFFLHSEHRSATGSVSVEDKSINNTRITPDLIHIPEWDLGPEDGLQVDLLPEVPPSGGWEYYHSNWRILEIRICLFSLQPHGTKHSKS